MPGSVAWRTSRETLPSRYCLWLYLAEIAMARRCCGGPRAALALALVTLLFRATPMIATAQAGSASQAGPAADGRHLADESVATQATFGAVWGSQAPARWVVEHNAALAAPGAEAAGAVAADGRRLGGESSATQASFQAVWGPQAGAQWILEHNAALAGSSSFPPAAAPPLPSMSPAPATVTAVATETPAPVTPARSPGAVMAWGFNYWGQLGDGTSAYVAPGYDSRGRFSSRRLTPVLVSGLSGVTAIAAASDHSLALAQDGTVWAWGSNRDGAIGDGSPATDQPTTTPVPVSGLSGATAIAAGPTHSLALTRDGMVWAWGNNDEGQLGVREDLRSLNAPAPVGGLGDVTAIAAGGGYSLALTRDGTVRAWGRNYDAELGDGTTTLRRAPVQVSGLRDVAGISAGLDHSLAVSRDGTVWGWGSNTHGKLGDGTTTSRKTPVAVSGLSGVVAIGAGGDHSLALTRNGTVWAWGNNTYGQLGDGTNESHVAPVVVSRLSGVVAIAASGDHSLALTRDGTVWAWGNNTYGQLGDGTEESHAVPAAVSGLSGVTGITAGPFDSLAR